MKKIKYIFVILLALFIVTGCDEKATEDIIKTNEKVKNIESNGETVKTSKMGQLKCTRNGKAGQGIITSLNYRLFYTGERLNMIFSEEKVSTSDSNILDTYENAYNKIKSRYEGLEYYDAVVTRGDTTVTNQITINYDKIDIDKLISIEGEKNNIFENKIPKVQKWIELGKKVGVTCEEVDTEKEEE